MTELARAFPVDASVMSRQVSKLVDRGLMSRKRRSHILHRACPASQAGRCAGPFHFPLAIDSHVRPRIKGGAGSELVEGPSDHGSTGSPRTGAPRNHSCEGRNPSMGRGGAPHPPSGRPRARARRHPIRHSCGSRNPSPSSLPRSHGSTGSPRTGKASRRHAREACPRGNGARASRGGRGLHRPSPGFLPTQE